MILVTNLAVALIVFIITVTYQDVAKHLGIGTVIAFYLTAHG